jgi:hypothetical protein
MATMFQDCGFKKLNHSFNYTLHVRHLTVAAGSKDAIQSQPT